MHEKVINRRDIMKIVKRYKSGETQQQIAESFGVSRQRIQQVLAMRHISKIDGGAHIKTFIRLSNTKESDFHERRSINTYGCSVSEVERINNGNRLDERGSPSQRYRDQRNNAKKRGIGWEITLVEWWDVWQQSGRWSERGVSGYVMSRIGDTGPYAKDNVEIKTASDNHKEGYLKTPAHERVKKRGDMRKSHCVRGHELTDKTRGSNGCKLCAVIRDREYRARIDRAKLKGGE